MILLLICIQSQSKATGMVLVCLLTSLTVPCVNKVVKNFSNKSAKSLVKISIVTSASMVRIITKGSLVFTKLSPLTNSVTEFQTVVHPFVFQSERFRTDGKVASKTAVQHRMVIPTELRQQSSKLRKKHSLNLTSFIDFRKGDGSFHRLFYFLFFITTTNSSSSSLIKRSTA